MSRSPREVMEDVRRMVAGEGVVFADLFAADGVLEYPFPAPGLPERLAGREEIRAFRGASARRGMIEIAGVDMLVRETDDPEVVVTEISHHGTVRASGEPYRFRALGVVRVRDGEIVHYADYMDPLLLTRMFDS